MALKSVGVAPSSACFRAVSAREETPAFMDSFLPSQPHPDRELDQSKGPKSTLVVYYVAPELQVVHPMGMLTIETPSNSCGTHKSL